MTVNHSVDWNKTCINISNRLSGLVWEKDVAPIVNLSERQVQNKLKGKPLDIEELYLFASLFGCSIDDLLVFEHDKFVEPERYAVTKREKMQLSTIVEISDTIDFNARHTRDCEIQNLAEFLLYLPLMPEKVLQDVVFRCIGNLSSFDRYYFITQMNYLYKTLPNNAAKDYADSYRDNVLRVKGNGELLYEPDEYSECCYSINSLLFTGQISREKYEDMLTDLTKLFGRRIFRIPIFTAIFLFIASRTLTLTPSRYK